MRIEPIKLKDVPSSWVYEFYLNILLDGFRHKMLSPFNPADTNPSMSIFLEDDGTWVWKDFSTGKRGWSVTLVMELLDLSFAQAMKRIVRDYVDFTRSGKEIHVLEEGVRWVFSGYGVRNWTVDDASFWSPYGISSEMLDRELVKPLDWYAYEKVDGSERFQFENLAVYGYFTTSGLLYKIYQPFNKNKKFICLRDHVEGMDTLNPEFKTFAIMSGKKDKMCMQLMGFKINIVCPSSENTPLDDGVLTQLWSTHNDGFTLFDNDAAGFLAAELYRQKDMVHVDVGLENDWADCVKTYGIDYMRKHFIKVWKERK